MKKKIMKLTAVAAVSLLANSAWAKADIATGPGTTVMSSGFVSISGNSVNLGNKGRATKIIGRNTTTARDAINIRGSLALGGDWYIKRRDLAKSLQLNVAEDWYGTVDPITDNASIPEDTTQDNNAHLYMTSNWDGTTTDTDVITIEGNAYGYTRIIPQKGGQAYTSPLTAKPTTLSDDVVIVNGTVENEHSFYGVMSTSGAGNVYLVRRDEHHYVWGELPSANSTTSYHAATSGQINTPKLVTELSLDLLANRHQRISQSVWSQLDQHARKATWGRVFGGILREQEKQQFAYESKYAGFQFGHEWDRLIRQDSEQDLTTLTRHGLTAAYVRAESKFYDRYFTDFDLLKGDYVTSENQVGKGSTNIWALGAYYTKDYAKSKEAMKQYVDFAGQVLYGTNTQQSIDRTSNHLFGFSVSGEYGRHVAQFRGWQAQLQSQLTFQTLWFSRYTDDNRSIDTPRRFSLRGRAGVRITPVNQTRRLLPYVVANIYREFMNTGSVEIGTDRVGGGKFAHSWYDAGVGVQYAFHQRSVQEPHGAFLYAEATYSHQLGTWSLRRSPVRINAGIRLPYNW